MMSKILCISLEQNEILVNISIPKWGVSLITMTRDAVTLSLISTVFKWNIHRASTSTLSDNQIYFYSSSNRILFHVFQMIPILIHMGISETLFIELSNKMLLRSCCTFTIIQYTSASSLMKNGIKSVKPLLVYCVQTRSWNIIN